MFAALLKDALSGSALIIRNRRRGSSPSLVPYASEQGVGAKSISFPLHAFEASILSHLKELDPRELLPAADGSADKVLVLTGKVADLEARVAKVRDEIIDGDDDVGLEVLRALERKRAAVAEVLAAARRDAATPLAASWGECKSILATLAAAPDPTAARMRLRSALRRICDGIWCLFTARGATRVAAVQLHFAGGGSRSYLIAHRRALTAPHAAAPERTWVRSFAEADVGGGLDLRKPAHARRLEKVLLTLDLDGMV
jgi:hypothetical protein